jgi:hypothetical protein
MRTRWTVGSIGAIAIGIGVFWAIGSSRAEDAPRGKPAQDPASVGIPSDELHDPTKPYEPGRSGIAYHQLSAADKARVDHIRETAEEAQPDGSYEAFAVATEWTSSNTEKQLAARAVGLVGTDEHGVVP